jgi:hypothetical protein
MAQLTNNEMWKVRWFFSRWSVEVVSLVGSCSSLGVGLCNIACYLSMLQSPLVLCFLGKSFMPQNLFLSNHSKGSISSRIASRGAEYGGYLAPAEPTIKQSISLPKGDLTLILELPVYPWGGKTAELREDQQTQTLEYTAHQNFSVVTLICLPNDTTLDDHQVTNE